MHYTRTCFFLFVLLLLGQNLWAQEKKITAAVTTATAPEAFPLVAAGKATPVLVDAADAEVVRIAAKAFSNDIRSITGLAPEVRVAGDAGKGVAVIAGTIGQSKLIDKLAENENTGISSIKGQWEAFRISVVDNPLPGLSKALVIAGSDSRGTAFGIFEVSRLLGVSPWNWWADVTPAKQENLYYKNGLVVQGPPAVKYRGIFLNDEDWGLQPWAAQNMDTDIKDIGPNTYARIFELLLRLKANLIWPAMHPSTKAFFHYPGNPKVADDYAIFVGTSHAEPMLRNNVDEWHEKTMGSFDYFSNRKRVHDYWEERTRQSKGLDAIYTVGMRGVHDSGMKGAKNATEAAAMLEKIIADQRALLKKYVNKEVAAVPQAFTAYKEVLDIYDKGLKLPEDITIVWPDDNYGYIHRLSNPAEQQRSGGSGVYYHASYWGRPHDYLWLSSTHPSLIREEMLKAYDMKAQEMWVLNVGDIKPLEHNISLFMDMAYRPETFRNSGSVKTHLQNWASEIFGPDKAEKIGNILWEYYNLAFERRPEFMGWSQTEPTTQTRRTTYNHFYYGDEAQQRLDRYEALEQQVKALRHQVKPEDAAAFYQLVYYPVVGASNINKKFLYLDKAHYYARQNRLSAQDYAALAKQAYDEIVNETDYYNNQLSGGKWKGMMSMKPRNLPVYLEPKLPNIELSAADAWHVAPEGYVTQDSVLFKKDAKGLALPTFTPWGSQEYFVDIYLSKEQRVKWKTKTSDKWIQLSAARGELTPALGQNQQRIRVSIDWSKAPKGKALDGAVAFKGAGKTMKLAVRAQAPAEPALADYQGFVESNGYISMFAENFTRKNDKQLVGWELQEGLGHTGKSLMALPLNAPLVTNTAQLKETAPVLEYDFYVLSEATPTVRVSTLPTHPVTSDYSMRYGISVDEGPVQVVDFKTVGRSEEWKQNVLSNSAMRSAKFDPLSKGKHTLKIYMIDPGVILDSITIDLGGLLPAYSTVPETKVGGSETEQMNSRL